MPRQLPASTMLIMLASAGQAGAVAGSCAPTRPAGGLRLGAAAGSHRGRRPPGAAAASLKGPLVLAAHLLLLQAQGDRVAETSGWWGTLSQQQSGCMPPAMLPLRSQHAPPSSHSIMHYLKLNIPRHTQTDSPCYCYRGAPPLA